MKKIIIAVGAVIVVAVVGVFAYQWYAVNQELGALVYEQEQIVGYLQANQAYVPQPAPNWDSFADAVSQRDTAAASQLLQDVYQEYVVPADKAMNDAYNQLNQQYHTQTGDDTKDLIHAPICPISYSYFQDTGLLTGCFPISSELVEQARQELAGN